VTVVRPLKLKDESRMTTTLESTITPNRRQTRPLSVIITGGLGCVGLAVTSCLSTRLPYAKIHVLDLSIPNDRRVPENKNQMEDDRFHEAVTKYHKVDVTDYVSSLEVFRAVKPQVVIHTAALIPSAAKEQGVGNESLTKVNVDGTKNVLDAARAVGAEVLVLTSSCDVVKKDSWQDLVNVSEKDDDLSANTKWDEKYSETKVSSYEHIQ
jgi:sterol-4alpha-carboxylate 3-dehydrogenase (decarboxylating)